MEWTPPVLTASCAKVEVLNSTNEPEASVTQMSRVGRIRQFRAQ